MKLDSRKECPVLMLGHPSVCACVRVCVCARLLGINTPFGRINGLWYYTPCIFRYFVSSDTLRSVPESFPFNASLNPKCNGSE